jgi:hypothetical protein
MEVITFSPDRSHVFQDVDLTLLRNFKKKMNEKLPLESDEITAKFIRGCLFASSSSAVRGRLVLGWWTSSTRSSINPII